MARITSKPASANYRDNYDRIFLDAVVERVVRDNPLVVMDYRGGNEKAFNSLVGQVMKATPESNPAEVNELLRQKLAER